jgi:uncharacterized membrane protein
VSTAIRPRSLPSPLRGAVAGLAGTAAMTVAQTAYQRATCTPPSGAPAEAARKTLRRLTGTRVKKTPQLNLAAHFGYGAGWGAAYSVAAHGPTSGVGFGAAVWGASLGLMPAMGLAPPVWRQDPTSVAPEVAFHVVYGVATAEADRALRDPEAPSRARDALRTLALGASAGMRTFMAPTALALRNPSLPLALRGASALAALGEVVGDKHPDVPDRRKPQALAGRVVSGAGSGWAVAGPLGAVAGGAATVTSALAMASARARVGKALGAPDALIAVAEDAIAAGLAWVGAAPRSG